MSELESPSSTGAHPAAKEIAIAERTGMVNEQRMGRKKPVLADGGKSKSDWIHHRYIVENCRESRVQRGVP
jgi:hypothetical protein